MTWYYAAGGQQLGPVDDAALDGLVRQGVVRDDTLVWKAGMANWQPHGTVRPRPEAPVPVPVAAASFGSQGAGPSSGGSPAAAASMAAAADMRYCSECGRPHPAHQLYTLGAATVCSACYPAYIQRTSMQTGGPQMGAPMQMGPQMQMAGPGQWHYGGFWIRFLARVIDGILVGIVSAVIRIPLMLLMGGGAIFSLGRADQDPAAALAAVPLIMGAVGISFLIQLAISLVYEVYFLVTRGATLGKIALGLRVVRADGGPITLGLATGRFFGLFLSYFTLMIGFIIAGFDPEKRSLHDRICNTRVIYTR